MLERSSRFRSSFSPLLAFSFGLALLLLAPSLSWSQDFEDSGTYQVSGAELNKLSKDLQTAKTELATSQTKNEQLEKDSESKAKALAELQTQLTTVSASFQKSQNEALLTTIEFSVASATAAALLTLILTH